MLYISVSIFDWGPCYLCLQR
uniref:Uncharacterized protein n=1 Tax=Rhizophora mucronata TaxID=61149 RepID=A0A2P2R289_RHIMU